MFGKSKVNQEEIENLKKKIELDDKVFAQLEEDRETFSADVEELDGSYRQVDADVNQVLENMKEAAAFAEENAKVEAELMHSLDDYRERVREAEDWQMTLCTEVKKLSDESARLVEENKHFTSPSKFMSEFAVELKGQNNSYTETLDEMKDYSKQMSVLALNAAIEAGRMGDQGKQFVTAAEDIRSYASNYDKAIIGLRSKLQQSEKKAEVLEEQVRHLVKLLKENNVSTARLMKSCNTLARRAEKEMPRGLSGEVTGFRNQVTILKNADEEIIKSEERNRMQMQDLTGEFAAQQQNQEDIFKLMDPVFRHVVERKTT